ncbi:tyrosine-type recombinase/integrase [Gandjariella thermophila]|uniref:tyrosine-type recombinase/integrase n=1 Tax=Gandjariella thermophila TaxID=1931992 RepID=UPI001CEFA9A6|nr:site-specific integrase [Gandjariella thermophila]
MVKSPPVVETEVEPFTVAEAQRILNAAAGRRNGVRFALALSLGLRRGEALGLKWADLDTRTGTLKIRRALQRHTWRHGCDDPAACAKPHHKTEPCKEGCKRHQRKCPPPCPPGCTGHARACPQRHGGGLVIAQVKSRAGKRSVHVPVPLLEALKAHKGNQDKEKKAAGNLWQDNGWIFAQPNGRALDPRADHDEWKALLAEAGVRDARLHDARHTAATVLLVLNVPHRAIMDVMGWSSTSMLTRYVHVPNEIRAGIANQVGGLLWKLPEAGIGSTADDESDGNDGTAGALVPA